MILSLSRLAPFCFAAATTVAAVAQTGSYYTTDPYNVPSPGYVSPSGSSATMWQVDPFGVGYNLLSGYRPINAGARQPVGHEMIPTRPDGNGYVYRPVYAPSPGYHYTRGGALIIEYPQQHPTLADTAFPTLPPSGGYGGPLMQPYESRPPGPIYSGPLPPEPLPLSRPREF